MDHKPTNPDTNSWVDDRMASLDPGAEWKPDTGRALDRLVQRKPALNSQWIRLAMTTTILAATVLVLVLLPWQGLWARKPLAAVAAKPQTAPPEKPTEYTWEKPTPAQHVEAAPQTPPTPAQQPSNVLANLPNTERELQQNLEQLAQQREPAQATPSTVTQPQVLHRVTPEYTPEAKEARIQGTVELVITIKTDGTVQFESFKKTLGYGLDEKAREALEQWTFSPATKDGVPVAAMSTVVMNFSLK